MLEGAMVDKVRVAAVQFSVTDDEAENLTTCLRMIDQAAAHEPMLMVLPEFVNRACLVRDFDKGYAQAISLDGPFLESISGKAIEHQCHIVINCTVRRANNTVSDTNILIGPDGKQLATSDKQVLIGAENEYIAKGTELCPIIQTSIGRIGMLSCMDGVLPETARGVALRGAQIICNTLNSFALDESTLHIPVRASENKVFVVAANKVGPLLPPEVTRDVAQTFGRNPSDFDGAGESQIVAPDGTILARAPFDEEGVAVADIDIALADKKIRPDGTDIYAARRPEIYGPIAVRSSTTSRSSALNKIEVAVYQTDKNAEDPIQEAVQSITDAAAQGIHLVVLPELFYLLEGITDDPIEAVKAGDCATKVLQEGLLGTETYAVTTVVADGHNGSYQHCAVLVGADGVVLRQRQMHPCARHPWATDLGDEIVTADMFWGRLALVAGGDVIFPEAYRLATLKDAHVVASPTALLERWEVETGLIERAAENRIAVVAATRPNNTCTSVIAASTIEFSSFDKPFRRFLNYPEVTVADVEPGLTKAVVYPIAASNRSMSPNTNVLENRPISLLGPMLRSNKEKQ